MENLDLQVFQKIFHCISLLFIIIICSTQPQTLCQISDLRKFNKKKQSSINHNQILILTLFQLFTVRVGGPKAFCFTASSDQMFSFFFGKRWAQSGIFFGWGFEILQPINQVTGNLNRPIVENGFYKHIIKFKSVNQTSIQWMNILDSSREFC